MTSLVKLAQSPRVRMMVSGRPKAGKTGALVSLINSGRYKVGILDYDNNPEPLIAFVKPEFRDNVSIITLEDKLWFDDMGAKKIITQGEPTAFRRGMLALNNWDDKEGHAWGPVRKWGPDYILVEDSLTSMGEAAFRRIMHINNRTKLSPRDKDWGLAMQDENAHLEILCGDDFQCHVVMMAHLKRLDPKMIREDKDDSDAMSTAKDLMTLRAAQLADDHEYPSALGRALPPEILKHFPVSVKLETRGGRRVIITKPEEGLKFDVGVPAANVANELPIESGLLTIFEAITGVKA